MSILIRGLNMPKSCLSCRFHKSIYCSLTDICTNTAQGCPLVSIPPHGDLIDRDALQFEECEYASSVFLIEKRKVDNAPTIIPAEEGE